MNGASCIVFYDKSVVLPMEGGTNSVMNKYINKKNIYLLFRFIIEHEGPTFNIRIFNNIKTFVGFENVNIHLNNTIRIAFKELSIIQTLYSVLK